MKKLATMVCLLMITCLSYAGNFKTPQIQNRMVNDYINLLSPTEKEELERKLVNFEQASSIEIVVVILEDLDGEEVSNAATQIGQDWKIGKKEIDNGIVLLVVKYNQSALGKLFSNGKTGDVFLATGYGIEPYISDMKAGRILDKYFMPHVRKKDFNTAISSTIDGIITELGEIGWQQREELRIKKEQESKEAFEKFFSILGAILGAAGIGGFFIWIIKIIKRKIKRYKEKRRTKRKFKDIINELQTKETEFLQKIKEKDIHKYPEWAKKEYEKKRDETISRIKEVQKKEDSFSKNYKENNINRIELDIRAIGIVIEDVENWTKIINNLEKQINQYKKEAPEKLKNCENDLLDFKSEIEKSKKTGFFINISERSHNNLYALFEKTKKLVSQKDMERKIVEECNLLIQKISKTKEDLLKIKRVKFHNDENIKSFKTFLEGIDQQYFNAEDRLEKLMEHPSELWKEIENNLTKVISLKTDLSKIINEAQKMNDMEIQEFEDAECSLKNALLIQNHINLYCNAPQQKLEEIANAKIGYETLLKSIPNEISKAKRKIQEGGSDIESSTKSILQKSESNFEKGKQLCTTNPVNWIIAYDLLKDVLRNAENAYSKASNDIDEAERRRRRQREEEDRQRRAREVTRRSSYSSSSSSRGFSGGGGSFGGGGAGRSF